MLLHELYHWSPAERRAAIRAGGLLTYQPAACHSHPGLRAPYVSLGTCPRSAWSLSGDVHDQAADVAEWDLWQVELGDHDDLRVRSDMGPGILEVKSYTPIPPARLWLVATRRPPVFEDAG